MWFSSSVPQKTYGPHGKLIIMELNKGLIANDWIDKCGGVWGSMVVFAVKPHQKHIEDIKKCIWCIMCVSFRGNNKVTKIFEYPILRCNTIFKWGHVSFGSLL